MLLPPARAANASRRDRASGSEIRDGAALRLSPDASTPRITSTVIRTAVPPSAPQGLQAPPARRHIARSDDNPPHRRELARLWRCGRVIAVRQGRAHTRTAPQANLFRTLPSLATRHPVRSRGPAPTGGGGLHHSRAFRASPAASAQCQHHDHSVRAARPIHPP